MVESHRGIQPLVTSRHFDTVKVPRPVPIVDYDYRVSTLMYIYICGLMLERVSHTVIHHTFVWQEKQ